MNLEQQKGKLLEAVTNPATASDMAPFFVFFKLVFKMAQTGMTLKTKQNLVRKQETMKKEMDDATVQIETQRAYIENLSFHQRISAEADRIRSEDVQTLVQKKSILQFSISEHQQKYENEDAFNRDYFNL